MEEPSPPSPGTSPVQLKDCVGELMKFTLNSSIKGELQTGLSNHYCSNLLEEDDPSNPSLTNAASRGVPSYPLYKRLASSLYQCIQSGALCTVYNELIPVPQDDSLKKKDEELNKLVMEKGSALLSMLKQVNFELHVQEPYFSQLNDGLKTIEGRCGVGNYKRMQSGHILLFNKCLMLQVQDIRQYASFHEMLETESLAQVLPGVSSIDEGVQIYRNFYSEEKERSNGVLAICVKMPTSQPHNIMASILSGLSYSGVQKLLGFVETTGTDPELLPPPASTLLSTFLAPHNPDNLLRFEFEPTPADSEKNRHAMDVIRRLLTQCSWMNMHMIRPHGNVFEIRTDDGYGARWSGDGTKFIGFLEPYMSDGHSCGWKH
ncbi:hypothetical protein PHJA_000662900 [Phtheirospermum japonicum]|uniref:ASCH domain-containing protein n=1 Tax=Phtheirospermum japonicum TaxID=374723 RepID=A0A830BG76_9LAMI|nr:hypothetical protein PHJA_000662900 [Phtheirospermum japonicum]